jgi:hypothetical protein
MCTLSKVTPGATEVYYPVFTNGLWNFNCLSAAGQVHLLLFDNPAATEPCQELPMSQTYVEELGASKWSIGVHTSDEVLYYQFRVNNDRILDPAGLETTDDIRWDNGKIVLPKCVARKENAEVNITTKPNIPMGRTILQEVNVGAYTNQGYAGLATKTGYLKRKCTTVSAMPIAQGDPGDVSFHNPLTGQLNNEASFYKPCFSSLRRRTSQPAVPRLCARLRRWCATCTTQGLSSLSTSSSTTLARATTRDRRFTSRLWARSVITSLKTA